MSPMQLFKANIVALSAILLTFAPSRGYATYVAKEMFAQMVELVDTRDLKSLDHNGRTGSSPVPGTKNERRKAL